jgi:hypothetical protein
MALNFGANLAMLALCIIGYGASSLRGDESG